MHPPLTAPSDNATIRLLLCGYSPEQAGRFLSIQDDDKHIRFISCLRPDSLPDQSNTGPIHCALINADDTARAAEAFVTHLRAHRPETGLILVSRVPQASSALARRLRVHDLIAVTDRPRLHLAIRRMYLASRMRPNRAAESNERKPGASPPAPSVPDRPTALFRPIVNLDGESRANYIVFAKRDEVSDSAGHPGSRILCSRDRRQTLSPEHTLVQLATNLLANLGEKAGVQLYVSPQAAQDESLLPAICESLRRFKVRGSNLQFCVDAAALHAEEPGLQRFIEGAHKINCRITCRDMDISQTPPDLLARYEVHMAQYSNSLLATLEDHPERERELRDFNRRMQSSGIKTLAGRVNRAEQLARLWRIRVSKAWGDYLQGPQPLDTSTTAIRDPGPQTETGNGYY